MEPRGAFSAYVVLTLLTLTLLSLQGHAVAATIVAGTIGSYALLLEVSYRIRSRGRRCLILEHRRTLDKLVRAQWICLFVIGVVLSRILDAADAQPLDDAGAAVKVLVIAFSIGIGTIYASSLVDWYWILPKLAGITGPPPCTTVVAKSHAGLTKIWFFHRGVATAVLTALIAGTPAYIAGTVTDDPVARAGLTLLGAAAAIGFNAATAGTVWMFKQFLSPRVEVGGYVRRRKDIDDLIAQDAYVVDVSVQGVKLKLEGDVTGEFAVDGDLVPYHEADRMKKSTRSTPLCPSIHECRAVNWYCIRNRNASATPAPAEKAPAPLPAEARNLDRPAGFQRLPLDSGA